MLDRNVILSGKAVLVTGAAGFIGCNLCKKLLNDYTCSELVGLDSITDYYDVNIKYERLKEIETLATSTGKKWTFVKANLADKAAIDNLFEKYHFNVVVNLAAQAGVRYSLTNPQAYIQSNIIGFFNILEACRNWPVEHLIYASSSSVYGQQEKTPFSTDDKVDEPVSLYAATKKSNELLAYSYAHLFDIPATGLRFFTVYGPFGRPDMAAFIFTRKIFNDEPIQIFNHGDMYRDFTYVDDIVQGIENMLCNPPKPNAKGDRAKVYNIGNNRPEKLMDFIETLERHIGKTARKEFLPMQAGDVYQTYADVDELYADFGFRPNTSVDFGLKKFVEWYRGYYNV